MSDDYRYIDETSYNEYDDYGEYPMTSVAWWEENEFKYDNVRADNFDWEFLTDE